MSTMTILLGIFLAPLALAFLFALWDDNFSARHHEHVRVMREMQERTDEAWSAYIWREEARKGAPCPECGLEWGYHRPYCRAWPGSAFETDLEPWVSA